MCEIYHFEARNSNERIDSDDGANSESRRLDGAPGARGAGDSISTVPLRARACAHA